MSLLIAINSHAQQLDYNKHFRIGDGYGFKNEAVDVARDSSGNMYVLGTYAGLVDFDPGVGRQEGYTLDDELNEIYFAKFDSAGNLSFVRFIESTGKLEPGGIDVDKDGNIIVGGTFYEVVDLNRGIRNQTFYTANSFRPDGFVAQYDSLGRLNWALQIGADSYDAVKDVACDLDGNVLITGGKSDTVDFNPLGSPYLVSTGTGWRDMFLAKYSQTGILRWVYADGEKSTDEGSKLAVDRWYDIYLTGRFNDSLDLDPSSANNYVFANAGDDVFFAKYDSSGGMYWGHSFGSNHHDEAKGIAVSKGNVYLTGSFRNTCDFDPSASTNSLTSAGLQDIYLARYDSTGAFDWVHQFGGSKTDKGMAVDADALGNVYLTGYYEMTNHDWDPSSGTAITTSIDEDAFLSSYDDKGDFRWVASTSGTDYDAGNAVSFFKRRVYYMGQLYDKADFDPSIANYLLQRTNVGKDRYGGFYAAYSSSNGSFQKAWLNTEGIGQNDIVNGLETDSLGNIYIGGSFANNADFDPGPGDSFLLYNSIFDMFVAKYDRQLNFEYAYGLSGPGQNAVTDIAADSSGNLFFAGQFKDSVRYRDANGKFQWLVHSNPGSLRDDVLFGKLDKSGKLLWIRTFGSGNNQEAVSSIAVDGQGNLAMMGNFEGTLDIDPSSTSTTNLISNGRLDVYLAKFDKNGSFLWGHSFGSTSSEAGEGVAIGPNDEVYITGGFLNRVDFDPGSTKNEVTSNGSYDIFYAKYTKNGIFRWVKSRGSSSVDIGTSLHCDGQGNIYGAGYFGGNMYIDPGISIDILYNSGSRDGLVMKLDSSGNYEWVRHFGGKTNDQIDDIDVKGNRVMVAGYFTDSIKYDSLRKTLHGQGSYDALIATMGIDGKDVKSLAVGGPYLDRSFCIEGQNEGIVVGGSFSGYADFDPNRSVTQNDTSRGLYDIFVLRLGGLPCDTTYDTLSLSSCQPLIYPGTTEQLDSTGSYRIIKKNPNSCDSILLVHFTLLSKEVSQTINACDSFYLQGRQLWATSSGLWNDSLLTTNGCDSIVVYDLTIQNSYSSNMQMASCDSFYLVGRQLYVSSTGVYVDSFAASNGCDSIVKWDVNINSSTLTTTAISGCDSAFTNTWVYSSGSYRDSLTSSKGCDSIVVWDVTIYASTITPIALSGCDSAWLPSANTWVYNSGTYRDSLTSNEGCDSMVEYSVSIYKPFAGFQIFSDSLVADSTQMDSFQWYSCGSDTVAIAGANDYWYKAIQSGDYALEVVAGSCKALSACQTVLITHNGRQEISSFDLYPNPFSTQVNLQLHDPTQWQSFELVDVNGRRRLYQEVNYHRNYQINTEHLPSGVYLLRLNAPDGRFEMMLLDKMD